MAMMTRVRITPAAVVLLFAPVIALAQTGRISGTVSETAAGPLARAHVLLPALGLSAVSGELGTFVMSGVPSGTYRVTVYRIGYKPSLRTGVVVTAGGDTRLVVAMDHSTTQLQDVVVSASRHAEKITDAAATVTVIDANALEARIGNSYNLALRSAPGLDVTQVGVTSTFVNGRGFNARFNTRWLTLEDGRVAILAETGLPIGEHTTIPKLDVASMEVITGPGSAIYGANASNGLLSVSSKDPRQYPGLSTEVSGGSRDLYDVQARYAGTSGKWGYKIAGEHLGANDFTNTITYPAVVTGGTALPETIADFRTQVARANGSLAYYLPNDAKLQFTTGISERDGLGDSNSGHYQITNYVYSTQQLMYSSPRWTAQAYFTHSNSGDTYQLYSAVPTQARNPTISADSVWALTRFHLDGRVYAAEVQNNFLVNMLAHTGIAAIDNALITWGGQVLRKRVSSYGKLFTDALTGEPILLDNEGVYAQLESPLAQAVKLVVAARYDAATRYDPQFSPRVSLLYTPFADQTLRVTYGEAYRAPPILSTDTYNLVSPTARNVGNRNGFIIKDSTGKVLNTINRLVPETNKTWEVGYKAVLANRLFVDVTLYRSKFINFISGGLVVADPASSARTWAYDASTGALFANAGKAVRVTTNYNLGEGIAGGIDAALRFYVTDHVAVSSTLSLTSLDTIKTLPTDPKDAGQYNTSSNRSSLALELKDLPKGFGASASARYVNGYQFRSGVLWGQVPSYGTIELSANYRLPGRGTVLMVQAQNLAACVSGTSTPPLAGLAANNKATFTARTSCGLGLRHQELLSMPAIGSMLFVGVRQDWR